MLFKRMNEGTTALAICKYTHHVSTSRLQNASTCYNEGMTDVSSTAPRSPCVISNILDILGDKWTFLVIRDLLFFGKHEYKEFLASPESIATNILADRLKKLKNAQIIDEMTHPLNRSRKLYYLTDKGRDLLPILIEMIGWGEKHLPKSEMMKPLFKRVRKDPKAFRREVLSALDEWERENLMIEEGLVREFR